MHDDLIIKDWNFVNVCLGLLNEGYKVIGNGINYPLNLLGLFVCIDYLNMTDPFWIGTTVTAYMTVVAYIRVFMVRSYFDRTTT